MLFLLVMLSVHAVVKTHKENLDNSFLGRHKIQDQVKTDVLNVDRNNVDEENLLQFPFDPGIFEVIQPYDDQNDVEKTKANPVEE